MKNTNENVLYIYHCIKCGHHGKRHLDDDSHDGELSDCTYCGEIITLEWDGGVKTTPNLNNIT